MFEIKKEKPYVMIVGKAEKILLGLGKEKNRKRSIELLKRRSKRIRDEDVQHMLQPYNAIVTVCATRFARKHKPRQCTR